MKMRVDNEKKPVLGIDLGTTYSAIADGLKRDLKFIKILEENIHGLQLFTLMKDRKSHS